MNTVLHGDCRTHLPTLQPASVQLVYLDPPFFTQQEHSLRPRDNSTEYRFSDRWESLPDYLTFMKTVLTSCRRLLKDDGSLFLHCDNTASHHLRLLLDDIFGCENFQSEIIWSYKRWSNTKKGLLNAHQTIYFYSRTSAFKFNVLYTDYSPTTNLDQVLQSRCRNEFGKAVYQRDDQGEVVLGKEKRGVPLSDVWNIPFLNPKAKERVGYPTQKPILLLERIIQIATAPGDGILDPFCGSGTTLVAAKLLGRHYLGIDSSLAAVELSEQRLQQPVKTDSLLLAKGEASYLEKSDYDRTILKSLGAVPVERNGGIDGFLKFHIENRPVSVKIQQPEEDLETATQKLLKASHAKGCRVMILVRTHKDNGCLFEPQVLDEKLMVIDALDFWRDRWLKTYGYSGIVDSG